MPSASDSAPATTVHPTGAPPSPPLTVYRDSTLGIFALLLAFRTVNALALQTFFQPDEYFQSLEPAWQLAFGENSNAWITWEWRTQLRSSLLPALFAAVYRIAANLAHVTQAVFAALLDCYTWKLAKKAYGRGSRTALAALALSVCSPWQWFCSTRTLSNSLETTITTVAICYWPWHWPATAKDGTTADKGQSQIAENHPRSSSKLRLSLLLAALACILRPTNALIWLFVFVPTLWQAAKRQQFVLVREILFCGSTVLACSVVSDRLYYGIWTLPPLRFLYFNIAQSLAVFYGRNRRDYYFTEGLPLLLTTALPFAATGLFRALQGKELYHSPISSSTSLGSPPAPELIHDAAQRRVLTRLAWTCVFTTVTLSLISHKEVRFLYPLLPFLHVIAAGPLSIVSPANSPTTRKALIASLLLINILLATFASRVHQRGVINVLHHLRHKHEARNNLSTLTHPPTFPLSNTTIAFLMPCHSTPWRSHLIYPSISAWALTCEPPLTLPPSLHPTYLDQADQFYLSPGPAPWLRQNMQSLDTISSSGSRSHRHWLQQDPRFKAAYRRPWPQNLVFFAQLESELGALLAQTRYRECWRGGNSLFHDDWRRVGDVVVWCLDEG